MVNSEIVILLCQKIMKCSLNIDDKINVLLNLMNIKKCTLTEHNLLQVYYL